MTKSWNRRVLASSMVEVLVALAIVSLIMGIAGTSVLRLMSSDPAYAYFLEKELTKLAQEEKALRQYTARQALLADSIPVGVEWLPYKENEGLLLLQVMVLRSDREYPIYRELVKREDGDD